MVEVKSNPEALDEAHTDDVKHTMLHENLYKLGLAIFSFFSLFQYFDRGVNLICGFTAASFLVL